MTAANGFEGDLLIRNLLELFNERNGITRRKLLSELWSENAVFIDPEGAHQGREKIDQAVERLFDSFPGFSFSVSGPVKSQHGIGYLPWAYGPTGKPQQISGIDVGLVEGGKLTALYTFVNPESV